MTQLDQHAAELRHSPDETRRRILTATRELYARYGSKGMTTREVAARAGVNEATIFRHFRTKHALIGSMREMYCQVSQLRTLVAGLSGGIESDLYALGLKLVEGMSASEDLIRISMAEEQMDPGGGDVTWRGYLEIHAVVNDYLRAQVVAGRLHGDPETIGRFFVGMLFAHVIAHKLYPDGKRPPLETIVTTCIDIFLNGVRQRRAEQAT